MSNKINIVKMIFRKSYSIKRVVIVFFIILLSDYLFLFFKGDCTFDNCIITILEGYGQGYFNLTSFLYFLIFNGIPLYLFSISLDEQCSDTNTHLLVRCHSRKNFLFLIQRAFVLFLILNYVFHFLSILVFLFVNFLGAESISYVQIINHNVFMNLVVSLFLNFVELLFCQLIITVIYLSSNKISLAFLVIVGCYSANLFIDFKYYPFGIYSFLRLSETDFVENALIPFLGFTCLIVCLQLYIIKKCIPKLSEG